MASLGRGRASRRTPDEQARLGRAETLDALSRLDAHARRLERVASGPRFESIIERERAQSPAFGGRTV